MSMFAKLAGAKITNGGTNIRDGKYRFMIEKIICRTNHKNEQLFIAELRVMQSSAVDEIAIGPDGWPYADGRKVEPNKVGSSCSFVANFKHESGPGNAKGMILGVLSAFGYTEDKLTEEKMAEACDQAKQPLAGMLVDSETYRSANQGRTTAANKGKPLVNHRWSPVKQSKEDVKAGKEYLKGTKAVSDPGSAPQPTAAPTPAAPATEVAPATAATPAAASSASLDDILA